DERLRTPMQWSSRPGLGFTTGTPWESAQPDSFTTTVESQNAAGESLLNLYRQLIHLRRRNAALATGELIPVTASDPGVAAYIRRAGDRAVLVVANLGRAESRDLTMRSVDGALGPSSYAPRNLLGGPAAASLEVDASGAIRNYHPLSRP